MNIKEAKTSDLVSAYNKAATEMGQNVIKKFANRDTAEKRTRDILDNLDAYRTYEGHLECPHCGCHHSNGYMIDEGEGNDVNGETVRNHSHRICCLGCGGEFGTPLKGAGEHSEARSVGIAKSWEDPEVAAKRAQRHGVEVTVDGGEKLYFGSVRKAYVQLGLPLSGHIKFRMHLKENGKVKENGRSWKVVPLQKVEKAPKAPAKKAPAKKKASAKK
jgi:hypothetical protein